MEWRGEVRVKCRFDRTVLRRDHQIIVSAGSIQYVERPFIDDDQNLYIIQPAFAFRIRPLSMSYKCSLHKVIEAHRALLLQVLLTLFFTPQIFRCLH